jgi:ribose transport system substrate-binding protein
VRCIRKLCQAKNVSPAAPEWQIHWRRLPSELSLPTALCLLPTFLLFLAGCTPTVTNSDGSASTGTSSHKPKVAYVTNGIAEFWVVAAKGAEAAARDADVDLFVRMPPDGAGDQKRMVQELLTQGVDGIAISPIDPDNQADLLEEIAAHSILVTQDSDAPKSKRRCYIGMDNYLAGRMCGQLIKEAIPEGGEVMLFVGRLEQLNARQRRQGIIDELLDRSSDSTRYDATGQPLKGDRYTVLDTRIDQFNFDRAKSMAQDAIVRYPELKCMVGLFSYNAPKCLEVVRHAGKLGQIKIVSFDEERDTLQGITDGEMFGTVVQNPYNYGYDSVRILAALARGEGQALPDSRFVNIPARKITKDNVQQFWDELKRLTGDGEKKPAAGSGQ